MKKQRGIAVFRFTHLTTLIADSPQSILIASLSKGSIGQNGEQIPAINIESANKNQGSVEAGITWLKSHNKIYINSKCIHTIDNFRRYSYKQDKNGIITTAITKLHDDCIDAIRYAFSYQVTNGGGVGSINWNEVAAFYPSPTPADIRRQILHTMLSYT